MEVEPDGLPPFEEGECGERGERREHAAAGAEAKGRFDDGQEQEVPHRRAGLEGVERHPEGDDSPVEGKPDDGAAAEAQEHEGPGCEGRGESPGVGLLAGRIVAALDRHLEEDERHGGDADTRDPRGAGLRMIEVAGQAEAAKCEHAAHTMDAGLSGKRVLVTGASGGIGAACARAFAGEGCRLALHWHRGRERADALATELGDVLLLQGDLTREEEADRVFAEARAALGGLDACAAVAGVWPAEDVPLWELPLERWEETLRRNLTVTFLTARAFLQEVRRCGHGSLVLVGSTAGLFGEAGHADYAAAKSAVVGGLLLSLKNEIVRIAPRARVNAVCPGWTVSPMTRSTLDDPGVLERATRTMALRKAAQPEDVARQVAVLASDHLSGHVTGQVVVVAGGMEGRVLHD